MGGSEAVRVLVLSNLAPYSNLLQDSLVDDNPRKPEAERVVDVLLMLLATLRDVPRQQPPVANAHYEPVFTDDLREKLEGKIGGVLTSRIAESGDAQLGYAILGG